MRLLYVIHQFFPDCHSGTEQYCLAVAREARRRGDEVTVLSLNWASHVAEPPIRLFELPYDGFRVLRLDHWVGLNPNGALRDYDNPHLDVWFQRVLDDAQPQAVHFFHLRQLGSNLLAVARRNGLRTVVSLTDFWYLCPRFTLLRADGALCEGPPEGGRGCIACAEPGLAGVEPAAGPAAPSAEPAARARALVDRLPKNLARLALADAVFAPSQFLAEMFAKNGFPRERIEVVPYGLEPGRIVPIVVQRPRSPLRLAFCGVLSPWKAPHLAIEAMRHVTSPVELRIHGRLEEPMFAEYIASLRAAAAGDARVHFMGAYVASDAAQVFADMDALIVPSTWYENTPFVVLEAFAAGVPVIASDLGGLREIVRDGENGVLFRAGDAQALAGAIERTMRLTATGGVSHVPPPGSVAAAYRTFTSCYRSAGPEPQACHPEPSQVALLSPPLGTMTENHGFTIRLDYPIHPKPRYGYGKPDHPQISAILGERRDAYTRTLRSFAALADTVSRIPVTQDAEDPIKPHWNNTWFEGIDALSVYGYLATTDPKRYFEIGSGNSTKFARQAIRDHRLRTTILSVDPHPRAEINSICDTVVRQPLEDIDIATFDQLEAGDVLFVDNSHRCFTNSDVTVVFLDIMPRLKRGVLLGIHDIMLPRDYPPDWMDRFYSEQYLLAAYLLARGTLFDVALPCTYVGMNAELMEHLAPVWSRLPTANPYGSAFWMSMR